MSTKSTVAATTFFGEKSFTSASKRASGTGTTPTLGSIVQNA